MIKVKTFMLVSLLYEKSLAWCIPYRQNMMKDIKNNVTKYRNCSISYTIRESDGKFFAHAQIHDPSSDNIETVWSEEDKPYHSQGEAEAEIFKLAKKIIDDLFDFK